MYLRGAIEVGMKAVLKIAAINVVLVGAALIVIEMIFGSWFHNRQLNHLSIPKNVEVRYAYHRSEGKAWTAIYRRDAFGLRGPYEALDEIDVLTMGGSTTDQRMLSENITWQAVLRDEFAAAGNPKTIVNAGVDGQSSFGHIRAFDLWLNKIPGLKSKRILVYVGINDMNMKTPTEYDGMIASSRSTRQLIVEKSALYYLYRTARRMVHAKVIDVTHGEPVLGRSWVPMPPAPAANDEEKNRLDAYGRRLRVLARRIQDFGSLPVFVTQPIAIAKIDGGQTFLREGQSPEGFFTLDRLNRRTMAVCRTLPESVCIDLAKELTLNASDYYDRVHYTPSGAAKIGRYLHSVLAGQLR